MQPESDISPGRPRRPRRRPGRRSRLGHRARISGSPPVPGKQPECHRTFKRRGRGPGRPLVSADSELTAGPPGRQGPAWRDTVVLAQWQRQAAGRIPSHATEPLCRQLRQAASPPPAAGPVIMVITAHPLTPGRPSPQLVAASRTWQSGHIHGSPAMSVY